MEGSPTTNGAGAGGPALPRCVLWHDPDAGAASIPTVGQLEAKLRDRGVGVIRAGSAAAALAELCTWSREGRGRGSAASGPLSVVIVGPEHRPGAGALTRALTRYVPHAVVWVFETGPVPVLRPATQAETRAWPGGAEPPAEPQVVVTPAASDISRGRRNDEPAAPRVRPALRLSGDASGVEVRRWAADEGGSGSARRAEDSAVNPEQDHPSDDQQTARQLLTQEELSMLLADDDPGDSRG